MSLKQQIGLLRTWLNSRKVVYCEPLKDIDFAKDIDDGLKLLDDVDGALSEAAKQIQELFDDTDSRAGDYRVISVVRGLKEEVLAILDGKEKEKPT